MQTPWRRRRRKAVSLGLVVLAVVLATATGAVALQPGRAAAVAPTVSGAQKPFLIGHKGAVRAAVRNTLPAMNAAFAAGVDGIEFDIVRTADNHVVVLSDPGLDGNTLNCTGSIQEYTYAQVRQCRTLDGSRIPTLEEALGVVRDHNGRLFLHTKILPNRAIAADMVAALEKYGLNSADRTTVFAFHGRMLDMLAAEGAERLGLIFNEDVKQAGWAANYDVLIPYNTATTPELVQAARARGVQVVLVESHPVTLAEALALDVDGLILDSIVEARAAIG